MSDNVDWSQREQWLNNGRQSAQPSEQPVEASPLPAHDDDMDELTRYRQDYADKRMDKLEAVAEKLADEMGHINVVLAQLPTKGTFAGWGVAIILAIFASAIAVAGVLLTSGSNQIAAFQAGMSAAQVAPSSHPTPSH
jgi:hypothetical protein